MPIGKHGRGWRQAATAGWLEAAQARPCSCCWQAGQQGRWLGCCGALRRRSAVSWRSLHKGTQISVQNEE